jgi:serine/threonine-protein kinase RsbW
MGKARKLSIPGRYEAISDACGFVIKGAKQAGFTDDDVFHIELACDEACTNVIEHSYGAEDVGELQIEWEFDDRFFIITICDNGRPFTPEDTPKVHVPTKDETIDQLQIGGLGLHFMHKLMDQVLFDFDKEHGNKLIMMKRRPK